jgi:hypothetical protein
MSDEPRDPNAAPSEPSSGGMPEGELKNWLIALHLSPLAMFLSIPFANVIAPLIIWLIKKDVSPEIDRHGKAVLNFQITICLAALVAVLLFMVFIGFLLLPLIVIFNLVMIIMGTVDASKGQLREYPLSMRFLK